jgi:hypothetical protein
MSVVSQVLAGIVILVCVVTAIGDFRKSDSVVAVMDRLKVPADSIALLGIVKLGLAVGLTVGLFEKRIGQVAGVIVVAYFAAAVLTHLRVKDGVRNTAPAFVLLVIGLLFVLTSFAA